MVRAWLPGAHLRLVLPRDGSSSQRARGESAAIANFCPRQSMLRASAAPHRRRHLSFVLGVLYPALRSLDTVCAVPTRARECRKWLAYWVLFALITAADRVQVRARELWSGTSRHALRTRREPFGEATLSDSGAPTQPLPELLWVPARLSARPPEPLGPRLPLCSQLLAEAASERWTPAMARYVPGIPAYYAIKCVVIIILLGKGTEVRHQATASGE